jgi:signal transduction histidine kinase
MDTSIASSPGDRSGDRLSMRRFFWLPLGVSVVLALVVLAALVLMSWRGLDRLRPVQDHLTHIARIQDVGLTMEQTLLKGLRGARIDPMELRRVRRELLEIAELEGAMHPQTGSRLRQVARRFGQLDTDSIELLFETLADVRTVLAAERERHESLLLDVTKTTRMELRLAVLLMVVLPVGGAAALLVLKDRIGQPLKDLQDLLTRLSGRDYRPVPEEVLRDTAKLAQPAFQSYNALVSRLQELEDEHRDRERTLERRVREATEALLAQSRELSRAERLAAVGAVSAGLAHELRNPLAGIQLACSKLQQQLGDGDQSARISAVITELKRINHLLTAQVDAARHAPEPSVKLSIPTVVNELLALLRYQTPPGIELEAQVDADLQCVLPAAGLRQALLNLVLNAVQIVGEAGRVEVSASRERDALIIRVSDDGPGFPEEVLRTGIRPFATGRAGGTGLGLTMVRRFVRDLDGDLVLANRSPHGAQATLSLPCKPLAESIDESIGESGDESHA